MIASAIIAQHSAGAPPRRTSPARVWRRHVPRGRGEGGRGKERKGGGARRGRGGGGGRRGGREEGKGGGEGKKGEEERGRGGVRRPQKIGVGAGGRDATARYVSHVRGIAGRSIHLNIGYPTHSV